MPLPPSLSITAPEFSLACTATTREIGYVIQSICIVCGTLLSVRIRSSGISPSTNRPFESVMVVGATTSGTVLRNCAQPPEHSTTVMTQARIAGSVADRVPQQTQNPAL